MFRHVTIYHQHDPNFSITCDLHQTCGVLHRTFAAYKSHVYRRHSAELYCTKKNNSNNDTNLILINNQQHDNAGSNIDLDIINSDDDTNENDTSNSLYDEIESVFEMDDYQTTSLAFTSHFKSIDNDENNSRSVLDIKRSYISFILNLREQMLLPKSITNMISTYIISLIERIQILSEKNGCFSYIDSSQTSATSFQTRKAKVIECEQLKNILNSICESIDSVSKNEYQLIKTCQDYFGYTSPEEIILSSADEDIERAYFIPLERSLSLMLNSKPFLVEILREVQQQRVATEIDHDLMYSVRDAYHGNKLDEETLLIQLYLDDISLTNPIGSKRDNHKMSMIYYTLEDIPHQYKSKLDFIYLLGICESYILKVNLTYENELTNHSFTIEHLFS